MRTRPHLACPLAVLLCLAAGPNLRAQGVPMFTRDYYLVEPARWVDKKVTISVSHVGTGQDAGDGNRRLKAYTYYNHLSGGNLDVVAPEAAAVRIIRQCGTRRQPLGRGNYRTAPIYGVFKREPTGKGDSYYLLVEK